MAAGSQRVTRSQSREIDSPIKRGRSPEPEAQERKRVTRSSSKSRGDSPHSTKRVMTTQEDVSRCVMNRYLEVQIFAS